MPLEAGQSRRPYTGVGAALEELDEAAFVDEGEGVEVAVVVIVVGGAERFGV